MCLIEVLGNELHVILKSVLEVLAFKKSVYTRFQKPIVKVSAFCSLPKLFASTVSDKASHKLLSG